MSVDVLKHMCVLEGLGLGGLRGWFGGVGHLLDRYRLEAGRRGDSEGALVHAVIVRLVLSRNLITNVLIKGQIYDLFG